MSKDKPALLEQLLSQHKDRRALVFLRTKHGAERLKRRLVDAGFAADSIHGNKSQGQRTRALDAFKSGDAKVLVATDVAARGIDIPQVKFVYNFDLPNVPESYVHRIGRTARAGEDGEAIAFCAQDEAASLRDIEKLLKTEIPVAGGIRWKREEEVKPEPRGAGRRRKPTGSGGPKRGSKPGGRPKSPKPGGPGKPKGRTPNRNKRRRMKGRG